MSKNSASREAKRARRAEEARQARIREGTASINSTFDGQFDDSFYGGIRDSYTNFARPQIDEQVADAREQLTFALARGGNLNSSTRVRQNADLSRDYDTALQDVQDRARQYETDTRGNVEGARSDLISMLQATGDAEGASKAALTRADIVSRPPAYSPLEQLFTDFTSGLAQQAAFERAYAAGYGPRPRYNTGLFGTPRGAVATTG